MADGSKFSGRELKILYVGDIVDIRHIDGKGTLELKAKETIQIMKVSSQLQEVPDASGDTITVAVTDADDNAITDTATFTEGADAKGAIVNHVMNDAYWEIAGGESLKIVTAGTTTTLGEVIIEIIAMRP